VGTETIIYGVHLAY